MGPAISDCRGDAKFLHGNRNKLATDVSAAVSGHNYTYSSVRLFCITGLIPV